MTKLTDVCPDFPEWPKRWMGVAKDLEYGDDLLEAMRPFAAYLVESGLDKKTIKKRFDNLWLLGGEIIRDVGLFEDYSISAPEKLKLAIDDDGGPSCRHLDSDVEERSYHSTCRMLHRFLSAQSDKT